MKLLIVIPALNEEQSIESIVRRSLEARAHIIAGSPVTAVDIAVVSEGSTDRTVERACRYGEAINLIVFEQNRGYGAAIKEAWRQSDADLLGFLEADGTCDPNLFADLCLTLVKEQADVVLGCRLTQTRKMPLVRQIGNRVFAAFLRALLLVLASFLELLRTGETYEHWSRFVAMSFFWSIGSIFAVTRVMDYVLDLLVAQLAYERQTARRRRDDPPAI